MSNNILFAIFLACCSLTFPSQSPCAEQIVLTVDVDQEDAVLRDEFSANMFQKLSENEIITMLLPSNPWDQTYFLTDNEETHVITLSHQDDTVYIMSVYEMGKSGDYEDEESEDETDLDCRQNETDCVTGDDVVISGHHAEYSHSILDGSAAEEFLYGWAGQAFAYRVLSKETVLELHRYCIQSVDHVIVLVVCGPSDQALAARVLEYVDSLKIESWDDLWGGDQT